MRVGRGMVGPRIKRLSGEKIFAEMVLENVYERLIYDSQYQERVLDR